MTTNPETAGVQPVACEHATLIVAGIMSEDADDLKNLSNDALNRMARADQRGTGCHLTAEMIRALSVTIIGDIWSQPDPRKETTHD